MGDSDIAKKLDGLCKQFQEMREEGIKNTARQKGIHDALAEIKDQLLIMNGRTRKNTIDIASLRAWVTIVGGVAGIASFLGVLLANLLR